jgi:hypothetical protein
VIDAQARSIPHLVNPANSTLLRVPIAGHVLARKASGVSPSTCITSGPTAPRESSSKWSQYNRRQAGLLRTTSQFRTLVTVKRLIEYALAPLFRKLHNRTGGALNVHV